MWTHGFHGYNVSQNDEITICLSLQNFRSIIKKNIKKCFYFRKRKHAQNIKKLNKLLFSYVLFNIIYYLTNKNNMYL